MMYLSDYTAMAWARTRQDELLRENREEREMNILGAEKNIIRQQIFPLRGLRKSAKRG